MNRGKLGVIGGMGPQATLQFCQRVVDLTEAHSDQEHLPMLADVNTAIPDRTAAILHGGPSPVPELVKSARRLEAAGADILLMSCNTAHYYYDEIAAAVSVPLLHMAREAAEALRRAGVRTAGVLATDGTVRSGVYEKALARAGVRAVYPGPPMQEQVMRLIYDGVKARSVPLENIPAETILADLRQRGAERFVLACTELPIAFKALGLMDGCLDATRALALAAVKAAGGTAVVPDPW